MFIIFMDIATLASDEERQSNFSSLLSLNLETDMC
jgi:hypothetical protein